MSVTVKLRPHIMLTLDETLAHQNNLHQLCADRSLETSEVFIPNAYYGIDLILKVYAGLATEYALKVIVPHGPYLSEDYIWEGECKALLPAVFCYPPYREPVYVNTTDKVVIPSASPFLYLLELLKKQPQPERKGTIFFPYHSSHHITIQMDFEALAEELIHLDSEYQPVTVCVYWKDFSLGHHMSFQRRGLRIVSAGHIYDPLFLFRFYHLCSIHRYSASNGFGSHLFYSVKSGCSYFHLDTVKYTLGGEEQVLKRDLAANSPAIESALRLLFDTPRSFLTAEQVEVVDYYLGADRLKPPKELRELIHYAEYLDKFGFAVDNRSHLRLMIPTFYRRIYHAVWRHGRQMIRHKLSWLQRTKGVSGGKSADEGDKTH